MDLYQFCLILSIVSFVIQAFQLSCLNDIAGSLAKIEGRRPPQRPSAGSSQTLGGSRAAASSESSSASKRDT